MKKIKFIALIAIVTLYTSNAYSADRIRIITESDAYNYAVKTAESFAKNSNYNTPIVEVLGQNAFKNFASNQAEILISSKPLPKNLQGEYKSAGIKELKIESKNIYIYTKSSAPDKLALKSLINNFANRQEGFKISSL